MKSMNGLIFRRIMMNERIQELLVEAHKQTKGGIYSGHPSEWTEKFAELIVRECNQAVLDVPCYYKDYRAQIEEAVINDCARAVLEHFGVEK